MPKRYEAVIQSYQALGLPLGAPQKEIRSAFRSLVKEWHPDVFRGEERQAEEETKKLTEAFSRLRSLSNEELQAAARAYSEPVPRPRAKPHRRNAPPPRPWTRRRRHTRPFTGEDWARDFRAPPPQSPPPRRGRDILGAAEVTVDEAISDVRWQFVLPTCRDCGGWGVDAGTEFRICELCHGFGRLLARRTIATCPRCRGRGCFFDKCCKTCQGSGESTEYTARCLVSAGLAQLTFGVLDGLGHPGVGGGDAGDLYLVIMALDG